MLRPGVLVGWPATELQGILVGLGSCRGCADWNTKLPSFAETDASEFGVNPAGGVRAPTDGPGLRRALSPRTRAEPQTDRSPERVYVQELPRLAHLVQPPGLRSHFALATEQCMQAF